MRPYTPAATRICLLKAHAKLIPNYTRAPYPEVAAELDWSTRPGDIFLVFASDPARAARLHQRLVQVSRAVGATPAEIRRDVLLVGNVVAYPNTFTGMTAARAGLIRRCLH
jgi:hypothetical protein